jgi:7-cyano-7-deazaguanine synthase in queuosine biosynthesis
MTKARTLALQNIRESTGRCPWQILFQVDGIPVSAFFRPPLETAKQVDESQVALLSIPILCDLAAEVRPSEVRVAQSCRLPAVHPIFDDSVSALLVDQDALWGRSRFTPMPVLKGEFSGAWRPEPNPLSPKRVVLGFSGGKDSMVSLFALLKAGYEVRPVLLNEGDRTWQDLRGWIPKLRRLGLKPMTVYLSTGRRNRLQERYGDWHYSSYQLGWVIATLALCATGIGAGVICLGIESSADHSFATFRGRKINHQYQKTTRHLRLLERFYQRVLNPSLKIGSPIAHVTDTEVLKALLEQVPIGFQAFSSCGGSNWQSKHCGECEKCAFVYALLSGSKEGQALAQRLFRRDLLEDVELYRPWIDARFRVPQACIGPREEVWRVLEELVESGSKKAVVRKWAGSPLRRGMLKRKVKVRRPKAATSPLTAPVADAAKVVQRWTTQYLTRTAGRDVS